MSDQTATKTLDSAPDHPQSDPDPAPAQDADSTSDPPPLTRNSSLSRLNAQAPEFVPSPRPVADPRLMIVPPAPSMVHVFPSPPGTPFPVPGPLIHHQQHGHHYHQKHPKEVVGGQAQTQQEKKDQGLGNNGVPRNGLSDEAAQKLINQVEYYFSDVNLATTDHLIRFINKDPEGFVPISVVATFKKIKALISSNSQLASVLRNSTKLAVSEDGKKVKRLHPVTNMDELQARIIVAENLPEDHCHQNLMKVFSAVGSVKSIRTCQPQPSNTGASSASRPSKAENMIYSNKLHAFVEYESVELAEKAIVQLNDEDDWRNGLRVRLLLKRGSKPAQVRAKKAVNEGEVNCEEEDVSTSEPNQNEKLSEEPSGLADAQSIDHGEEQSSEKEGGKKGRNRNRVKGRGRGQNPHYNHHQNNKGNHAGVSPTVSEQPKQQPPPGPRMPDGTRGFSMGRGKPITVNTAE